MSFPAVELFWIHLSFLANVWHLGASQGNRSDMFSYLFALEFHWDDDAISLYFLNNLVFEHVHLYKQTLLSFSASPEPHTASQQLWALPALKTEWSSSAVLMHQYVSTPLAAGLVHSMHFLLCEYFFFLNSRVNVKTML